MHFFVENEAIMTRFKKMLFIAIVDAIATQLYINIFGDAFRISIAVAILPVFYYIDQELNPIQTGGMIALVGLLFRAFVNLNVLFNDVALYVDDVYIIVFDMVYALIFFYFFYKQEEKVIFNWLMVVFFADLFANLAELVSRNSSIIDHLNQLIVIAFIRTLISLGILLIFYYFRNFFRKEMDRKKFNDLMGIFSDIKSEVYLMNNNIKYIESIMTDAYLLYDNIEDNNVRKNKNKALKIAQNVHEIKKNYIGILNGLSALEFNQDIYNRMKMSQMFSILRQNAEKDIKKNALGISIEFRLEEDFYVKKHFYLMSVLRNLINNSLEAMESSQKNRKKISIRCHRIKDVYIFSVFDNGPGIKEKNIDYVFNNGFSTKFTNDGKIHRGLGLSLVKEIVEKEFSGNIEVSSNIKRFTRMKVMIHEKQLKEESNELFYN